MFCSVAVLFGMGCSRGVGCFVRRFGPPWFVDRVLCSILFGIGVMFEYGVSFGVLFAEKMFCLFSRFGLNSVRVR